MSERSVVLADSCLAGENLWGLVEDLHWGRARNEFGGPYDG